MKRKKNEKMSRKEGEETRLIHVLIKFRLIMVYKLSINKCIYQYATKKFFYFQISNRHVTPGNYFYRKIYNFDVLYTAWFK